MKKQEIKHINLMKKIRDFEIKGFCIIENFFSTTELKKLDDTLRNIIIKVSNDNNFKKIKNFSSLEFKNLFEKLKIDNPSFSGAIYDAMQTSLTLQSMVTSKKVIYILSKLLNSKESSLSNFFRTMRLDVPKSKGHLLSWHQDFMDSNFKDLDSVDGIAIWVPLNDVSKKLGSIEICVASHKKRLKVNLKKRKDINTSEILNIDIKKIKNYGKQIIKCSKSDAVFMNMNCVHRSVAGDSNFIRRTIIARYMDIKSEGFVPGSMKFIPSKLK